MCIKPLPTQIQCVSQFTRTGAQGRSGGVQSGAETRQKRFLRQFGPDAGAFDTGQPMVNLHGDFRFQIGHLAVCGLKSEAIPGEVLAVLVSVKPGKGERQGGRPVPQTAVSRVLPRIKTQRQVGSPGASGGIDPGGGFVA